MYEIKIDCGYEELCDSTSGACTDTIELPVKGFLLIKTNVLGPIVFFLAIIILATIIYCIVQRTRNSTCGYSRGNQA